MLILLAMLIIPDFYSVIREHNKRSSGGVIILVKDNISTYVKPVKSMSCKDIVWISLDECLLGITFVLGCVYIPPENSVYADMGKFDDL